MSPCLYSSCPVRPAKLRRITSTESSLKAGEVQLKRSGSSQPFSSSQCLIAAPKTRKKGMSEIQHRIHAFPAASPQQESSAPASLKEQHWQVMGMACNTPGLSSCFAAVQPIPPLVCIPSASCCHPLPPGAGFLHVLQGCTRPGAITQNCKEE